MNPKDLFNPDLFDKDVLDEEILLYFESGYRSLKEYCTKNHIEWPNEFVVFRKRLLDFFQKAQGNTSKPKYDDKLVEICKRIVKGKVWLSEHEDHPNFEGALRLYESLVNKLTVYQKTESDVEKILETVQDAEYSNILDGYADKIN